MTLKLFIDDGAINNFFRPSFVGIKKSPSSCSIIWSVDPFLLVIEIDSITQTFGLDTLAPQRGNWCKLAGF